MKKSALAILASLALLAFPLAAQVPEEEPTPLEDTAQEIEQEAEEVGQEIEQEAEEVGNEIEEAADEVEQEIDEAVAPDTDSELDEELPQTASPLVALILMGLAGASSALGVRSARRK